MDIKELHTRGWTVVSGVSNQGDLIEIANMLGEIISAPSGELVKKLVPANRGEARKGTFSSVFGKGSFPLHTDTAFWPVPARYLILKVTGDTRRKTSVLPFSILLDSGDSTLISRAERSVWRVVASNVSFYCSMRFRNCSTTGWRYDEQCMRAANEAAEDLHAEIRKHFLGVSVHLIDWAGSNVAILDNWKVLHGREKGPSDEGKRVLERIYVR